MAPRAAPTTCARAGAPRWATSRSPRAGRSPPRARSAVLAERLFALEYRPLLRQERAVPDAEVLGAEARKALVVLGVAQRRGVAQPARELLVPARHQRRTVGDALRRRPRFGLDLIVGHDARDQALVAG